MTFKTALTAIVGGALLATGLSSCGSDETPKPQSARASKHASGTLLHRAYEKIIVQGKWETLPESFGGGRGYLLTQENQTVGGKHYDLVAFVYQCQSDGTPRSLGVVGARGEGTLTIESAMDGDVTPYGTFPLDGKADLRHTMTIQFEDASMRASGENVNLLLSLSAEPPTTGEAIGSAFYNAALQNLVRK